VLTNHFSQASGRIATKLAHDGLQVSVHPGCAQGQGQGQKSRDTDTFVLARKSLLEDYCMGYIESFIIRVKFAIYYFLHFNKVRQVATRLRAKSAIYDCLVVLVTCVPIYNRQQYSTQH